MASPDETPEQYDALCSHSGELEREVAGLRADARAMAGRIDELREEVIASHAQIFDLQERAKADAHTIAAQARLIEALTKEG